VEQSVTSIPEDHEATCWGCGLRLVFASYSPIYKCGWCGAVTQSNNQTARKPDSIWFSHWRRLRDRLFVAVLVLFMLFVICTLPPAISCHRHEFITCHGYSFVIQFLGHLFIDPVILFDTGGGVWAVYPVVFSVSKFCGVFHCTVAAVLAVCTVTSYCLASLKCAGAPTDIRWGSYPVVGKGDLENYTFCTYCSKPKPPRAHHCRSCKMCVVDMDHHCPFVSMIAALFSFCLYVCCCSLLVDLFIHPVLFLFKCRLATAWEHQTIKCLWFFSFLWLSVALMSLG
jgi:hypothetical protein